MGAFLRRIALLGLMGAAGWGQVTLEWAERYGSPSQGFDEARAIVTDSAGDSYLTGSANGEIVTIKYKPDGTVDWMATYSSSSPNQSFGQAIVLDSAGNVIVAGSSYEQGSGWDYVVVKYDSNGNEQWVQRLTGAGGDTGPGDTLGGLAVDAAGNIYVTGTSQRFEGDGSRMDVATACYAPDGKLLWANYWPGDFGEESGGGRAICVDDAGTCYVAVYYWNTMDTDILTIKYNSSGEIEWKALWNGTGGPGTGDDPIGIAYGADGNVYVAGTMQSGFNSDYVLLSYVPSGADRFATLFDRGGSKGPDYAYAFAASPKGLYVTGYSYGGPSGGDVGTVAFDFDGVILWEKFWENPQGSSYDQGTAVTADASGSVYVEATSKGNMYFDYITIKYDADGQEQWLAEYDVNGGMDYPYAIALGPQGTVFVTGSSDSNTGNADYLTLKYKQGGGPETYYPTAAQTIKGTFNSGTLQSFTADDDNYWVQGAQYDPTDPLAVINSTLQADTNAASSSYASGSVKVIEKTTTTQAKYRIRAVKSNGGFATLVDGVQTGFSEVTFDQALPSPVSDFVDAANGNRLTLHIRAAASNRVAGFFRHSIDLASWTLTP